MPASFMSFSSDMYKNTIFTGFSRLQEAQEFVDLTLAADGHLIKVHKNIIALASPYLKEMVKSASSQSPVIFLNNVSHQILTYLLEYIYQGEVNIPEPYIQSFLEVASSLKIHGISAFNQTPICKPEAKAKAKPEEKPVLMENDECEQDELPTETSISLSRPTVQKNVVYLTFDDTEINTGASTAQMDNQTIQDNTNNDTNDHASTDRLLVEKQVKPLYAPVESERSINYAARITINSNHNLEVQQFVENLPVSISNQNTSRTKEIHDSMPIIDVLDCEDQNLTNTDMEIENSVPQEQNLDSVTAEKPSSNLVESIINNEEYRDALKRITQYTVSQRGALQIIVNRFVYCCHHISRGGRKYRWRCFDYRASRCPAYIDSFDGEICLRKGAHNHGFHDDRIYKKHRSGKIYYSLKEAQDAKNLPILNETEDDDEIKELIFNKC